MRTEPELLNERLDRLALVLDEIMPNCANLVRDALELLKEQEAVVRCKDCKHYKDGFCYNPNTYDDEKTKGNTVPDWFCADGERK